MHHSTKVYFVLPSEPLSFGDGVSQKKVRKQFELFLLRNCCVELLDFWFDVQKYKRKLSQTTIQNVIKRAKKLCKKYLDPDEDTYINVTEADIRHVIQSIRCPDNVDFSTLFDTICKEVESSLITRWLDFISKCNKSQPVPCL